ncbi:MAG: HAMP domain-containing sensor histidine kinase [Aestuariivirga sp.]
MRAGSLRLRLLSAATFSIFAALIAAGFALTSLFEREVRDRVVHELNNDLLQLVGSIDFSEKGEIKLVRPLADRRFETPYGGKYWWLERVNPSITTTSKVLRSRSFWDSEPNVGDAHVGPDGELLVITERTISIASKLGDISIHLVVGTTADEITSPLVKFRNRLVLYLSLIGLALMAAAWAQVSVGLKPLQTLREQLSELHTSQAKQLEGEFPTEVEPLILEFNNVLKLRDRSLERARHRAGDLAHGLMTPLTILATVARDLNKRKLSKQAFAIDSQVETMRRHVERGLVRARLATGRGHELTGLAEAIDAVLATLRRLPENKEICWISSVHAEALVPIERDDLLELLGNLLDNARKFAKSRVQIGFNGQRLLIEDDGPGVAEGELAKIHQRGKRLDESKKGFGLGLAIVEDIADLYELKLSFGRSALGGLQVAVDLRREGG